MLHTPLCNLLGIEHPIIQAGMGTFTAAELVAAVSNAGGLGSLGAANRPADDLTKQLALIRELTSSPFAVNHLVPTLDEEAFALTLEARPPIISFALGDPGDLVKRAHDAGALVMHQVTTVRQARQAAERGVDVIVAQGSESGGFGGTVAASTLVPQVVDAVSPIPVVAAGGIADGRGLAAALILGAQGVNIGTRFLASVEAPVGEGHKQAITQAESEDAIKVEVWNDIIPLPGTGGYGTVPRAIRTPFIETWQQRRSEAKQQAERLQGEIMQAIRQGRFHEIAPFAGQTAGAIRDILPAGEIVRRMVAEAQEALERAVRLLA
jgi:enoyl-[acyl-carrier protein] reductase II